MGKFGDKRLDKRAAQLSALLFFGGSSSIHGITTAEAEQKGAYRFLSNFRAEEDIIIKAVKERSSYLCKGREVLVIQDSSEINVENHHNRLVPDSGIGPTGNNKDIGFFLHTSLVLDAHKKTALGFSDIQLWHRAQDKENKAQRGYKNQPMEEKESNKWIKACRESQTHLAGAQSLTFIEDREGDIYEQFATIPDERTHLLVRSRDNRKLASGERLFDYLAAQPLAGTYEVEIVGDIRKGVESRRAQVEVRFCKAALCKPRNCKDATLAREVELWAVEAREVKAEGVVNTIAWRLLTTHRVESYEQAIAIIGNYRLRWYIEQLYRLIKTKGFHIESSELELGWAIRKLTVMVLNAGLRVMQLLLAYRSQESQAIKEVFDEGEIKCLKAVNATLQGESEKSCNHNDAQKLCWATWIIARLGGWKNYNSKRPPGPIVLKKGLDKFMAIYEGWKLAQEALNRAGP
ncbi:IS4 family transposase [Paraflavisolibacter sp. H34]|uniref:IS4 family transposase n=1 Tax=Huijunlia imazamoxiresistens TaxID=3127457 RepID=UPI00301A9B83